MKNINVLQKLQQSDGYVVDTHVELTGLDHSDTYFNKDLLLSSSKALKVVGAMVADEASVEVEVVCGPPVGGLIIAEAAVLALSDRDQATKLVVINKKPDGMRVKRGQEALLAGKKVLVVDDVVKTGKSLVVTLSAVREAGGIVVGIVILVNWRGASDLKLGLDMEITELLPRPKIYKPSDCGLCRKKVELIQKL